MTSKFKTLAAIALFTGACAPAEDHQAEAILEVKTFIDTELDALAAAAEALAAAAPAADADGWTAATDATAVNAMKAEWKKARISYEKVEGAIAVLFPDLDAATDERYDGFVETEKDTNLFDDLIVTGVHGIERVLWADSHPSHVVEFESELPNYVAAAFPADATQSGDYKTKLAAKLVVDCKKMRDDFAGLALDSASAFRGVIGSVEEQLEKVKLASTGEDESRYAAHTLADMRANLAGGLAVYEAFAHWLGTKEGGAALDTKIRAGFARVKAAYDENSGEGIPAVPSGFNPDSPSTEHLATPYGKLFDLLSKESDPANTAGLVFDMLAAADLLGVPRLAE